MARLTRAASRAKSTSAEKLPLVPPPSAVACASSNQVPPPRGWGSSKRKARLNTPGSPGDGRTKSAPDQSPAPAT